MSVCLLKDIFATGGGIGTLYFEKSRESSLMNTKMEVEVENIKSKENNKNNSKQEGEPQEAG